MRVNYALGKRYLLVCKAHSFQPNLTIQLILGIGDNLLTKFIQPIGEILPKPVQFCFTEQVDALPRVASTQRGCNGQKK